MIVTGGWIQVMKAGESGGKKNKKALEERQCGHIDAARLIMSSSPRCSIVYETRGTRMVKHL